MPSIINATTTGGVVVSGDNSGSLQLQNSGVTELTVASTGVTVTDNLLFNSGYGSAAVAYGCRAWVNFDGTTNTGGFCTIRGSGNVTSVADNGTGDYTVNFTTAMPDANYAMIGTSNLGSGGNFTTVVAPSRADSPFTSTPTTSSFRLTSSPLSAGAQDATFVSIAVFR